MGLVFRQGIFCSVVDGCAILLDLCEGRYFTPPPDANRLLREMEAEGSDSLPCDDAWRPMIARGWLVERTEAEDGGVLTRWPKPDGAFVSDDHQAPRMSDMFLAFLRQAVAARELRRFTLATRVDRLRTARHIGKSAMDHRRASQIARAFDTVDRILSPHDRCLPRSIALFRALLSADYSPSLVLGVRVRPFAAHAWVQLQDAVVGDELDRVRAYRPILVL